MQRRSFLQFVLAALPSSLFAQMSEVAPTTKAVSVPAGKDREGQTRAIGVSSTTYKVLTQETGGAHFVLEQLNHKKGGPNRHLHHAQDELFYVLEGSTSLKSATSASTSKPVTVFSVHAKFPTPGRSSATPPAACSSHSRQQERWKHTSTSSTRSAINLDRTLPQEMTLR
jgi:hypothetical protein